MNFEQSITQLKGIGEKNAALFRKLNIETIGDLLFHFPKGYESYPACETLDALEREGKTKGSVYACISANPTVSYANGTNIVRFWAKDENGRSFQISYFHMPYLKKTLKPGMKFVFYGAINERNGSVIMNHPKMITKDVYDGMQSAMQPVYLSTKGLTSQSIAKYCKNALDQIEEIAEYLPDELVSQRGFMSVRESLHELHLPKTMERLQLARARFAYEEFLFFLLAMRMEKDVKKSHCQYKMIETADVSLLIEKLPYKLTDSQIMAYEQIKTDMLSGFCMNRLLQGDVGSGKTIVAILALLLCVSNGYQGAMMAPTEVLATQHMETIQQMIQKYHLPFKPVLLTGSLSARQKRECYAGISDHTYNLVIGTHAVIQKGVQFDHLALVVTDEQHRFGVKQRENLVSKGGDIHTIVMSATPIPRSLGMILYGDLDITEMKELPSDRLKIKNCVVDQRKRPDSYHFMQEQLDGGHQVYIICPMAQPGVMEELENVVDYAQKLPAYFKPGTRIAYLHGKMKPKDKAMVMEQFAAHEIDILVSTTVIEVGINVPNATVIMIENAERFGLATLHQIRGRVGRGSSQSYCIFMQSDGSKKTNERLSILNHSNDGFEIANEDLRLRGPGDFMGVQQSGSFQFQFADIYQDADMLRKASQDADLLLQNDALLLKESSLPLKQKLEQYIANGYLHVL